MKIAPKITLDTTVVASKDQASADLGDEAAILNLREGLYYRLDSAGARIWKFIQEPKTVRDVRDVLLGEYEVDAERCEGDLIALLGRLAEHGLVDIVGNA